MLHLKVSAILATVSGTQIAFDNPMVRGLIGLTLVVAAVALPSGRSSAQSPQSNQEPGKQEQLLTKEDAGSTMRMLLTIQANRPFGKGKYGLLQEILSGVTLAHVDPVIIDRQTATYRGYTIRVLRTPDMTKFDLTMVPSGGLCGTIYFSNEQNIIYTGQALGCPQQ